VQAEGTKRYPIFVAVDPEVRDFHTRNIAEPDGAGRAPSASECSYVQIALQRFETIRATPDVEFPEPTLSELAQASGKNVRRCELRAGNWRHKVYLVEFEDGTLAIAKQVVMGNEAMLRHQYEQLRELAQLNIAALRVPKQLGLFLQKRVLLMEFAPGRSIEALAWSSPDVVVACDLAGKTLAEIQIARTETIAPLPVELIARDLAAAPWRLSTREKQVLKRALDKLAKTNVRIGEVYYDYKPANLLLYNRQLFLVDPPDSLWRGVHLWDFACFRSSMRRHIWRMILRKPFATRQPRIVQKAIELFGGTYRASFAERRQDCAFSPLAVRLFELQRNAVLITNQEAKVKLTREKLPIARGKRLGHPFANRITLPLLEFEKRWLFRQLARDLASS
jgi:hypothetical protein